MTASHRLLLNSIAIYGKIIVAIFCGLFSTRLILQALGAADFGIYAVVGALVAYMSFLQNITSSTTRRFLSYHRSSDTVSVIFSTSIAIHLCAAILFFFLAELLGWLFLDSLDIPKERIHAAYFVFHCIVVSATATITLTPFSALVQAKENLVFYAICNIVDSLLKLSLAFFLFISPMDALETYGVGIAFITVLHSVWQCLFCLVRHKEIRIKMNLVNKKFAKQMLAFTGWNWVELVCATASLQGIPILLNLFCGVVTNAAYGIANQVRGAVGQFAATFPLVVAPQIVSGIAEDKTERSHRLAVTICKFSAFAIALFAVPILCNTHFVLQVWLGEAPHYAASFCRWALLYTFISVCVSGLNSLVEGKGKIVAYKICLGISNQVALGVSFILLKMGLPPVSVFVGLVASAFIGAFVQIYFARKHTGLSVLNYFKQIGCIILLVIFSFSCTYAISLFSYPSPWLRLACTTTLSTTLMLGGLWLALDVNEKRFATKLIYKLTSKSKKRNV
jgi:O-antigen/teichoic acid export membrane protein